MISFAVGMSSKFAVLISHGSVLVFQVGIGFSVYRSVLFQVGSVFVVGISKTSRYRFGIFGISLCVKATRADPKILLQYANFDRRSMSA